MNRLEITSNNFEEKVRTARGVKMIMYMADWCKACKKAMSAYDEVTLQYMDRSIKFGTGNVDDSPQLISLNELMVIPVFILYKDGKIVKKMEGVKTKEELSEVIERYI